MILKPTFKLRWIEVHPEDNPIVMAKYYYGEQLYLQLQQCFLDEEGKEVWKPIEIEYNP